MEILGQKALTSDRSLGPEAKYSSDTIYILWFGIYKICTLI